MRPLRALLATLCFALFETSSGATERSWYPVILKSEMGPAGSSKAFVNLATYAQCVIKHERKAVLAFLSLDYPSADWRERGQQLASETTFCLRNTALLSLNPSYMRGALIEAAYHHDRTAGKTSRPATLGSALVIDPKFTPALAECLVQKRRDSVDRLLSTPIASPAQRDAFLGLEPDLGTCARQVKVTTYNPEILRFQIAEHLYREHRELAEAAE